ncbi:anaphase-promoting complex subunit cdc27 [Ascosphaera acerosa]|nr:anaphase-promoting complex subunit cdc27 [Ascosphaera acerosa]
MAPSVPHISSQLRQLIYYQLDNNRLRNALFLAGRLHAVEPRSADAAYLLALCHYRIGQSKAALEASKHHALRGTHLGCAYVFAQACLDLGRHVDGVNALDNCRQLWANRNTWNKHSESRRQPLPDAAAVLCLQGTLWQAYRNNAKAVDCYVEALRRNPFMWDAFLGLCKIGVDVKVANIYRMSPAMREMIEAAEPLPYDSRQDRSQKVVTPCSNALHKQGWLKLDTNRSALLDKQSAANSTLPPVTGSTMPSTAYDGLETPVAKGVGGSFSSNAGEGLIPTSSQGEGTFEPPLAPSRKQRTIQAPAADYLSEPPPKMRSMRSKTHRTRSNADIAEEGTVPTTSTTTAATTAAATARSTREPSLQPPSSQQTPPHGNRQRKRNVSGQLVEPPHLQRRSARLGNQGSWLISTRTATSSIPTLGVEARESREMRKPTSSSSRSRTTSSSSSSATAVAAASGLLRRKASAGSKSLRDGLTDDATLAPMGSQNHRQHPAAPATESLDRAEDVLAVQYILKLLCTLATGCFALSKYRCREATQAFESLPASQRDEPWVLTQLGKAHYEQALYSEAEKYFARARAIAPAMLDDMEIYSTVLWHLKDEVELAYLAHELMDIDRLSPEAWCAIGNSFSLQQEHDQALKCFRRATQLDPLFAYGFTLQGHEHVANEEHEKALDAYRAAIAANNRLYNAWYGLGKVYERLGKLDHALRHFHAACTINPTNSVLVTCIAALHERAGDYDAAEEQATRSVSLAPQSVYARLRRARVLMKLRRLDEALAELNVLKDMAPDEVQVYELLGRVYKLAKDKGKMIQHFTTAMNLDPRAAQYLKEVMENSDDDFFDEDDELLA